MLQFCLISLRKNRHIRHTAFHLGSHSFIEFKGVLSFLYISNQFIFNKGSKTKLNNIFGFCFFLRLFHNNLRVLEHFLNLPLSPFAEENE